MLANSLISALLLGATQISAGNATRVPGLDYGTEKARGVNIGGWFVLEPYMNPSFFKNEENFADPPVDEYSLTQALGKEKSQEILEKHWDTWIQESDFANLASWGLNFARIPIGYWAFIDRPQDPYVQGQIKYLDRAIGWARKHGIKVWVDLHGVPGSQNGFDNSGWRDHYQWQDAGPNLNDTYTALQKLIDRYAGPELYDTVIGIEVVNEPLGNAEGILSFAKPVNMTELKSYYNSGYERVRAKGDQGVILHDAFQNYSYWNNSFNSPDYYNVVMDHHIYQYASNEMLEWTIDEHVNFTCNLGEEIRLSDPKWNIVGEWSAAMTDCAPNLFGVGRGHLYDGTLLDTKPIGSCKGMENIAEWPEEHKVNTRRYIEAQLDAWEHAGSGWAIWAYKAEAADEWDLRHLVEHGIFPNPVMDRKYPNQCHYW